MGPALGPILGGALAQAFGWRATFWFLSIFTTLCFVAFVYFKDTFRRERSLTYQTTLLRLLRQRKEAETARQRSGTSSIADIAATNPNVKIDEKDKSRFDEKHPPTGVEVTNMDVEAQRPSARPVPNVEELKLSLRDFNPVKPIIQVLCRPNNLVILFASGTSMRYSPRPVVLMPLFQGLHSHSTTL